ncbi:MAG: dephospho-CoA kinase [Oscillospiraceae bacterium]|nr:dephospho-CoA kinase [Oscillospiraceae bacterium]
MIIGITGGSGCGKTTALQALETLGAVILDCDAIYHELLQKDTAMLTAIENRFPGTVVAGALQRKKLGQIVFNDKKALEDLNQITHCAVKAEVEKHLGNDLVAIDAIGLFESGLNELCHITVAITAPLEDRIARLMARDNIPKEYALARIQAQPSDEEFAQRCDHVLVNDRTKETFYNKCLAFFRQLGIMKENQ